MANVNLDELIPLVEGTDVSPLARGDAPSSGRHFFWQRWNRKELDYDAIATQPSVFEDPDLAKYYAPRPDYENLHRFDPNARWTYGEEYVAAQIFVVDVQRLLRKIDWLVCAWACIMFMCLLFT
jgi:hypothetical protein